LFVSIGEAFAAHDAVRNSERKYAGVCRCQFAEGRNTAFGGQWPACSIASTRTHANLYSNEIDLRWLQRF
jgi:hypothetical protein